MAKILLCLLFLMPLSTSLVASEKAFNILTKNGFKAEDLIQVVSLAPELKDFEVTSDSEAVVQKNTASLSIKFFSDKSNEAYRILKTGSNVSVEALSSVFEVEVKAFEGVIQNNIFDTIEHDTHSTEIAKTLSDAFSDEFTTSKGLRFRPVYRFQVEQYFENGRFIRYGNVLHASLIIGLAMTTKTYRMDPENFTWGLFPEHSGNTEKPFFRPVESGRVTSAFQLNRRHPVTGRHQPHKGIDFKAPNGSPIFPAMAGEVVVISRTRSKGKYVTISHENGYQTTYVHLKSFAKGLRVGQWVDLDDLIGEVGRTGYSTGAHLHFGVIQDGHFVNPLHLLKRFTFKGQNLDKKGDLSIEDKNPISDELIEEESEDQVLEGASLQEPV